MKILDGKRLEHICSPGKELVVRLANPPKAVRDELQESLSEDAVLRWPGEAGWVPPHSEDDEDEGEAEAMQDEAFVEEGAEEEHVEACDEEVMPNEEGAMTNEEAAMQHEEEEKEDESWGPWGMHEEALADMHMDDNEAEAETADEAHARYMAVKKRVEERVRMRAATAQDTFPDVSAQDVGQTYVESDGTVWTTVDNVTWESPEGTWTEEGGLVANADKPRPPSTPPPAKTTPPPAKTRPPPRKSLRSIGVVVATAKAKGRASTSRGSSACAAWQVVSTATQLSTIVHHE